MPQVQQGHDAAAKEQSPLKQHVFRAFSGVYTSASRNAIPDDKVYNLENVIPIGPQNAQVVNNISAPLADITALGQVYLAQAVNLRGSPNGDDDIFLLTTTGNIIDFNTHNLQAGVLNPLLPLSGAGSSLSQWSNDTVLFIDSTGFYEYKTNRVPPVLKITGPGVPTSGDGIAVYASRVWITQGRVLFTSGAGDYSAASWLPQNGASFNVLIDPSIRSGGITKMVAANGVLYLFAVSSINVIYNVTVPIGAVPPTPIYTNQNIQPLIGTDQPASIIPFDQSTLFANRYGVWSVYGVAIPKLSDDINGTWQHIDFTQPISAGQVVVEGILCGAFLIKRSGDTHFADGSRLAVWMKNDGKDCWWFGKFGNLNLVVSAVVGGVATLYGFINDSIYRLFFDPTTAPPVLLETKLWPFEDDIQSKEAMRVGFLSEYSVYGNQIDLTVDGLNVSTDANITLALSGGLWINDSLDTGLWTDGVNTGGWITTGFLLASGGAPGMFSHNLGLTLTSTGYRYRLNLMAIDYRLRDRWT